jgi:hypothetical protein
MPKIDNPLEIYKHLPKTNCRKCGVPTCLAFASAVVKGGKRIADCPYADAGTVSLIDGNIGERASIEQEQQDEMARLMSELAGMDLSSVAGRSGGSYADGRLSIMSLGREFVLGTDGSLSSNCHTANPWFVIPLLNYLLYGKGLELSGVWTPFDELRGGLGWSRLFGQRAAGALKVVADAHPDLFSNLTAVFSGGTEGRFMDADVSLVLHPFPKLPVLVCYWRAEGDFESKLGLYFDATAADNLGVESVYILSVGLVMMFEVIAQRHR